MPSPNLNTAQVTVDTSNDSVVIVDNFQSIRGGRSLDATGFTPTTIYAGHPIIKETSTGIYKPNPLTADGTALAALPAGHTYGGILIGSILTARPFAGILVRGTVNPKATAFDMTAILAAIKTALPLIDFRED